MKFIDVVSLTQEAISQSLGQEYKISDGVNADGTPKYIIVGTGDINALSSYQLVDIGKSVEESGATDAYVKSLLSQMGKMVIDSKKYTAELPSLFVDNFDWGGYVERIYFTPQDLINDEMYDLVDGRTYDDHRFYKPRVSAKIYEESKTIMCPISITRDQIKMAFNSWDQLNSFYSGIYNNVANTIELAMEAYAHMLISCGIAVACKSTGNEIKLLSEYKSISGDDSITAESALRNSNFLIYALSRIADIRDNMHRYATAYNNGSIPTFTSDDDFRLALLSKFANSVKFNVRANTFHENLLGVGDYDRVSAWQAFKSTADENINKFDFDTISSIMISADPTNKLGIGIDAITINNIIGVAYDHRAMGICPHRVKITNNYTAIADFWNEYHHTLVNYILDANYNIVVFTLN